jgi:RHS repeat-associated protein
MSSDPSASVTVNAQPNCYELSDQNYVHTKTPMIATSSMSTLTDAQKIETVQYYDGLGRVMQAVGIRAGGNSEDIVTHIAYDTYGRQDREYLPYAGSSNGGLYRTNALSATNTFYNTSKYENTTNPYSEKHLEASPLSRILEQGAPGADWAVNKQSDSDHTIKFGYQTNTGTEVRLYEVDLSFADNTYTPQLIGGTTYYAAGKLYKTITKDENWTSGTAHTTEEFKDNQGRVLLKRTYGASDINRDGDTNDPNESVAQHDTYYVYDDFGNLSYVLPPQADAHSAIPSSTKLLELCYQYKYDHRNRLVEKKIPGKGWEDIVYNKLDQPVMTRDENLKNQGKWLFTKYDAFGRVAYTGIKNSSSSRVTLQNAANSTSQQYVSKQTSSSSIAGTTIYYNGNTNVYPTYVSEILTINYYDNYTFDKSPLANPPSLIDGQTVINYNNASGTQKLTKGLATGSKVRVLDSSPVKWITSVTYYDTKGRPIYAASHNAYLSTTDIVKSTLDFTGNVTKTVATHTKGGTTITTVDDFGYDHMNRLVSQKQKINSLDEELIVLNEYDGLGQLENKKVGGAVAQQIENSNGLQTVDYAYNVRGWLKKINDPTNLGSDLFGFKINYNTVDHNGTELYNGNISETEWKTANTNTTSYPVSGRYTYTYDALNRITKAEDNTGNYDLELVNYDMNGNITALQRRGHTQLDANGNVTSLGGLMDDLVYTYESDSNQLKKVLDNGADDYGFNDSADWGTEYTYDENGNMTRDPNKLISDIDYNYLNLPTKVTFNGTNNYIDYIYDANGVKLEKKVTDSGVETLTKYAGNYIYKNTGGNDALEFFNHPEGYVDASGSGYDYIYQYKDHLGNVRLSYSDTNGDGQIAAATEILEENNYYPFGLEHKGYNNTPITNHPYKYQGVELNESLGLNLYEFSLRQYDAALGRFFATDPYEQFYSPYLAMGNNPITSFDPDGGKCFDMNGNEIACPDDDIYDDYRDDKNHITIDEEIDVGTAYNTGKVVEKDDSYLKNGDKVKEYYFGVRVGMKIAPAMNERPDSNRRDFDELMLNVFGYYSYRQGGIGSPIHHVDENGVVVAAAPTHNDSGALEFLGGLPVIRIGKYAIAAKTLHRVIKPKILKKVGKKTYERVVGRNPDIGVENGKIILKGNGPFKNKTYRTNLDADDYLK